MSKNEKATFMSPNPSLSVGLKSQMFKEVNGIRELIPGIRANFENQLFTTEDKDVIKLMRENKHNTANGGKYFTEANVKASDDIKDEFAKFQEGNKSLEEKNADAEAEANAEGEASKKAPRKTVAKKSAKKSKAKFND